MAIILLPLFTLAQEGTGIRFERGLNWFQVLQKAKKEHKPIFMDCYATWCGPCKQMDANVYPLKEVGDFYNRHFICVKAQMDKTNKDDSLIKAWYRNVEGLAKNYTINAYPTFLFLDTDGNAVHKVMGSMNAEAFIQAGKEALDPEKQYYTVVKSYKPGTLDTAKLRELIMAFRYSDRKLAQQMAKEYIPKLTQEAFAQKDNVTIIQVFQSDSVVKKSALDYIARLKPSDLNNLNNGSLIYLFRTDPKAQKVAGQYIAKLPEQKLYDNGTIAFMTAFTKSTADRGFEFLYQHPEEADKITKRPGASRQFTGYWISKELIGPKLQAAKTSGSNPDWQELTAIVLRQYPHYGKKATDSLVLSTKFGYYQSINEWQAYANAVEEAMRMYPPGKEDMRFSGVTSQSRSATPGKDEDAWGLNGVAWAVFQGCNDTTILSKAIVWANEAIKLGEGTSNLYQYYDTKANLLYKLGKKEEALRYEAQAVKLYPGDREVQNAYELMKKGLPTWH